MAKKQVAIDDVTMMMNCEYEDDSDDKATLTVKQVRKNDDD